MNSERAASDLPSFELNASDRATLEAAGFLFGGTSWGAYVFRNENISESIRVGTGARPFNRHARDSRTRSFKTAAAAVK